MIFKDVWSDISMAISVFCMVHPFIALAIFFALFVAVIAFFSSIQ